MESLYTDESGAFVSGPLWPGDLYQASVMTDRFVRAESQKVLSRREEAVQVLDLMDGHDGDKTRVEALGWLAVVMARRDKETAIKLIDQSLELLLDKPEAFRSWGNFGGRSVLAAWIARQAREIGYPDMDRVVMRVLATRPTMSDEFDSRRRLEHNVGLALVLGFSAPQAARQVLEVCEPAGQLVGSGSSMIRRRHSGPGISPLISAASGFRTRSGRSSGVVFVPEAMR